MAILELTDVEKRFGGLPAVAGVTFTVDEGEIVALVGPNGAGKTTLLKAIGGMQPPTRGRIVFDGADLTGARAHRVRHAGVAMVLQTPRTVRDDDRRRERRARCAVRRVSVRSQEEAMRRAADMLEFVGLADRRDEPVGSLNLHEQRFLEIARQLAGRPRLVLLDEVMAGLNDTELASSIDMVRRARAEFGVTVIWVEHVMKAVMSLAERILVLNFGALIADGRPGDVMRQPDVVTAYLGERGGCVRHDAILRVDGLSAGYAGEHIVHDISLEVAEGEAITVIGSNGAGKSTLLKAIVGMLDGTRGTVTFDGAGISRLATHRIARRGLAYVPAERHLFPHMTVAENLALGAFPGRPEAAREDLVFDLFPRLAERRKQDAGTLSGGEQQMLAVGRALMSNPKVLMLDEPSTGLAPLLADGGLPRAGEAP